MLVVAPRKKRSHLRRRRSLQLDPEFTGEYDADRLTRQRIVFIRVVVVRRGITPTACEIMMTGRAGPTKKEIGDGCDIEEEEDRRLLEREAGQWRRERIKLVIVEALVSTLNSTGKEKLRERGFW
ncbi:hypothetical protein Nepgr_004410 [Nepenthes gracilis]|uniref:Uncharacterized protein n=1 Tax=Nepenthes gracilis TaxID=150966 RepID=A0AAD3S1N5_NEPGR|nr:hypothetical protein Nepgr_004410 [Nepenthes gracilis]